MARYRASANASACSVGKVQGLGKDGPVELAAAAYPLMRKLSFDDVFCVNETCPPVIGNIFVYRDTNHLTGHLRSRWRLCWKTS